MKQFLVLCFMFYAIIAGGQTLPSIDSLKKDVKETVSAIDTSSTFKTMYADVKAGLVGIASALKIGAEHVYEVLVKQQIVNAITHVVVGIIGLLMLFNWFSAYKDEEEAWFTEEEDVSGIGAVRMIQAVFTLIIFLVFIFHIDTIVMGFVNPEYGALKEIIEFAK